MQIQNQLGRLFPEIMYAPQTASYFGIKIDDLQMWNWRWVMIGTESRTIQSEAFDKALQKHFNDAQRSIMQWPPERAKSWMKQTLPNGLSPMSEERLDDAQDRLFPRKLSVVGNVVRVNFAERG